jgi:branched-subunit amino acid transport protein
MPTILIEIFLIGAGTYFLRAGSLSLGSKVSWPEWVKTWLSYVAPAVLGALLGPILFLPDNGHWVPIAHNSMLIASVPTVVVAWFSRHLLLTVVTGVLCFAAVTHFM